MWKKGEIVWVSLNLSDTWIPGQIQDPSEPFGVLVSFFGLMESRYVPKPFLRSFDRDFGSLIADSWKYRRFVNRALQTQFWNISSGLWCSCQSPIDSPYFDRESSLPWCSSDSDSGLGFVREMAISLRVPLRRLAETNNSTAQILSFRRYIVDFKISESIYEEVSESAKLMDFSEEPDWCLDPLYEMEMDCIDLVSMLPERVDSDVGISGDLSVYTWNTRTSLNKSGSSILKPCETVARKAHHEDDVNSSKRRGRWQLEQSILLLNSELPTEDIIEEDTTSVATPRVSVSEAPPDVMIETHDDIIGSDDRTVTSVKEFSPLVNASNNKVLMAKPVSFVVLEACENLASSVKETFANSRSKLDSSMNSAKTLDEESSYRTTENCSNDALESQIVEIGQVSVHSTGSSKRAYSVDDVGIAPAEQLQDLGAVTTVESQTVAVDNVKSIGVKRKASRDKASATKSKRKKKASQQSISTEEPPNLHLMKDMRLASPKCLRMKFLSRHGNLPSKSELLKKFSMFGKIDTSRTDVNQEESSAKIVFLQSIDAVTAYQFARSKKFTLGRCKVIYRLDPYEEDNEVNKVPVSQTPQNSSLSPRSCLKKHGLVDSEEARRNRKVKFQMKTSQ
ncbi:hypothetical protein AALP_AA4G075500 [Arabis alpina]|uniref:Uncharacterized protein n=1 Tax=Arabis alpina TaxID=50452 RepID=A0A087H1T3_ARAAL|nr:hypothetical protein AALP_AA4G075500 [Arabis alpina]